MSNAAGFAKAKNRERVLSRSYASLRATVHAVRKEVQAYLDDSPEPQKPMFAWYFENLDTAFKALDRDKPDFYAKPPHRDDRDIRRTLAEELELDEK